MQFPLNARLPIVYIAGAIFCAGLVAGTGASYAIYQGKLEEARRTNATLMAFNKSQSLWLVKAGQGGLEQRAPDKAFVQVPAAPAPVAQPSSAPVATPAPADAAAAAKKPIAPPQPATTATKSAKAEPAKKAATDAAPAPVTPAPRAAATLASQIVAQQPAPAPAPAATLPAPITMEQAGIAGIDTAGIRFKSGRHVLVGSEFPTGEKLVSVNPAEGRIVTDRRVIILAKPPLAQ